MKLLTLVISNIAPYRRRQVIKFDQLPDLFLVYGPTGSGKSTIFDCVCLALYNKTSGEVEKGNPVYPVGNVIGHISLKFEVSGQVFVIEREYKKDRSSKVSLHLPDGTSLNKQTLVLRQIEDLIGLTYSQFIRSSIIAQGEFQKILRAGTRERQELLQSIFNTYKYEDLVNALRDEYTVTRKRLDEESLKVDTVLDGRTLDGLKIELEEYKKNVHRCLNDISKLNDLKTESVDQLEQVGEKLNTLKSYDLNKAEVDRLLEQLKLAEEALVRHQQEINLNVRLHEESESSARNKLKQDCIEADIRKHQENSDKLNAELRRLSERSLEVKSGITRIEEEEKTRQETLQTLSSDLIKHKETLASYLERLSVLLEELRLLEEGNTELKKRVELSNYVDSLCLQYTSGCKDAEMRRSEALFIISEKQRVLEDQIKQLKFNLIEAKKNRKTTLISELVNLSGNDSKCPICGGLWESCVDTTSGTDDYMSIQEDINKQTLEAQKLELQTQEIESRYKLDIEKLKDLKSLRDQKELELVLIGDIDKEAFSDEALKLKQSSRDELNGSIDRIDSSIKETENKIQLLQTANKTEILKEYEDLLTDIQHDISKLDEDVSESKKFIESLTLDLTKYPYTEEMLQQHTLSGNRLIELQRLDPEQKVNLIKEQLVSEQIKLESLSISGLSKEKLDQESTQLMRRISDLSDGISDLTDEKQEYNSSIAVLESQIAKYEKFKESYESALAALQKTSVYEPLWKAKVGIGAYAVAYYLEAILEITNTILQITRPRYRLVRDQEEGGRGKKGLDLLVYDSETNQTRSVDTLSGGETFVTALALAIGSSITYSKFNNKMPDILLLDEGFGTLDRQTLEEVILMLTEISKTCKIGVISHVSSLQTQLGVSLEVGTTVSEGSYVRQLKRRNIE